MSDPSRLIVHPQANPLLGTIRVPGDKSISHRAVMLAALAEGVSTIRNWLPAGDTLATLEAVRALGVNIDIEKPLPQAWNLQVEGRGLHGLRRPAGVLDCRNAGTAIRLLAGIMAGQAFPSTLDGSDQLRRRPMLRITEPLTRMGADIKAEAGYPPLHIRPAGLSGIEYELPVASAQVKSALLLAGLYCDEPVRVFQPGPARDHTERMLMAMGEVITMQDGWVMLGDAPPGGRRLLPLDMTVPGDFSSAGFPLVAATVVPDSSIVIRHVGINSTRTGLLEILQSMGASVMLDNQQVTGGELVADLHVRYSELRATDVAGPVVVRAIDEFPVWAVAATQATGVSTVRDAAELRVKEVDRIAVMAGELRRMAVAVTEQADGFSINGPTQLHGASVDSHDDHRLAMALAVAGLVADEFSIVHDAACISDSFPGFVETLQQLGAAMEWAAD